MLSVKSKKQQGFTLIELMVVVVIMAVVISAGVSAMGRVNQNLAENQQASIQSLLQQAADESAFSQTLFLVMPNATGLSTYWLKNDQWQQIEFLKPFTWHPSFKAEWQLDEQFAKQQQLPGPGWLFWPSGEVMAGEVVLTSLSNDADAEQRRLSWNESLEFARQTSGNS